MVSPSTNFHSTLRCDRMDNSTTNYIPKSFFINLWVLLHPLSLFTCGCDLGGKTNSLMSLPNDMIIGSKTNGAENCYRQHDLTCYFKTLIISPDWDLNPVTTQQSLCSTYWTNSTVCYYVYKCCWEDRYNSVNHFVFRCMLKNWKEEMK